MKDFESELCFFLDALLAEGIEECLDCGLKNTIRTGYLFEENEQLRGMFSCNVNVEVSFRDRSQPWNVGALVYAFGKTTFGAWEAVWQEGQELMTMGEAGASCEFQLRRDHPAVFGAYDALRERQGLDSITPDDTGKNGPLRI